MANELMKKRFKELESIAYAAGLRHYDIQFFEVPTSVIYEVASYGLPTRYSHWSFGKVYQYQKAVVAVTEQVRFSSQALQDNTSQAYRVLASSTIDSQVYTSATTSLVLQLPATDSAGNIISGVWDYVVFYLSGEKFFQRVVPGVGSFRLPTLKLLSDSVTSLAITYDNVNFNLVQKVSFDVAFAQIVAKQTVTSRFQENLYLKNYY